jgi:serine/threonine protein kinase
MQAVAQLSHPNIVSSFSDEAIGNAHFFAMEFVEGTDLNRMVQLSGPLPVPLACDFIRQASLGLQHAHEQGLIHRDIKPGNLVQLAGTQTIKVLDFGLARLHRGQGPSQPTELTAQGVMMGTADYIAPEQARDARSVDHRADIYSLGCTFYHLLAGHPPFPGGSALQKIHNHFKVEPPPLVSLRPEVPGEVSAIVQKMIAKDPDYRYQTLAEVADLLRPYCPPAGEQGT